MQIRAKTKSGDVVTIIGFVVKYDKTYAVTILRNGCLWEFPISDLTIIDTFR